MSKIPFFKFFSKSKFSVSNVNRIKDKVTKVGWAFSPTLKYCWGRNPNLHKNSDDLIGKKSINSSPSHPELVSGSYHLQEYTDFNINKSNVGVETPTYNNISLNTKERSIIWKCLRLHSPRRIAFTLAEVLITLGIIGVVAAMTLPTLIQSQQEKEKVVRLKKAYSVLNSAIQRAITEDGPISSWSGINTSLIAEDDMSDEEKEEISAANGATISTFLSHIKPYLNVIKYCEDPNDDICAPKMPRYSLAGTAYSYVRDRVVLSDGTAITSVWISNPTCSAKAGNAKALQKVCGQMFVDIKADKTDRKVTGDTVFLFWITEYGLYPMGSAMETQYTFEDYCNISKTNSLNGYGCTAWVLQNENLDYKKCSGLGWDGKKKCK